MSEATVETGAPSDGGQKPAPTAAKAGSGYKWYVLAILTGVYTFNFVDRQIVGIVAPALKADLGLSDSALGLLSGFAFAFLYTVLGIPIARLADRYSRVNIVSVSLAVWSGFTALSAAAGNFTALLAARIGVGVGEAGGSPPSHSILSDYFPKEQRATALAVYSLGIPFGTTFAYLAGGWTVEHFGWRGAFLLVGLPGLLLAALLKFTVREPVRGAFDPGAAEKSAAAAKEPFFKPLWAAFKHFWSIPTWRWLAIGTTFVSFGGYGTFAFLTAYMVRAFPEHFIVDGAIALSRITVPLAFVNGLGYGIGTFLGGRITDSLAANNKRWYALVPAIGVGLLAPTAVCALLAPTPMWMFILLTPAHILLGCYLGPAFAAVQTLAPVHLRAVSTALFFFILNLFALGLGPTWVGAVSDIVSGGNATAASLRIGLMTLFFFNAAAALSYWRAARYVEADWKKAEETNG